MIDLKLTQADASRRDGEIIQLTKDASKGEPVSEIERYNVQSSSVLTRTHWYSPNEGIEANGRYVGLDLGVGRYKISFLEISWRNISNAHPFSRLSHRTV